MSRLVQQRASLARSRAGRLGLAEHEQAQDVQVLIVTPRASTLVTIAPPSIAAPAQGSPTQSLLIADTSERIGSVSPAQPVDRAELDVDVPRSLRDSCGPWVAREALRTYRACAVPAAPRVPRELGCDVLA